MNALRPDTTAVIGELGEAGIRTVMVTGDHVRTGVSVAAQCGMLCQRRPVVLADTAAAEGRVADSALSLAVMAQHGGPAAAEAAPENGDEPVALLARVAAGTMQAAVTGRGFEKVRAEGSWAGARTKLGLACSVSGSPLPLCQPAFSGPGCPTALASCTAP